jgi:hypothetical protein
LMVFILYHSFFLSFLPPHPLIQSHYYKHVPYVYTCVYDYAHIYVYIYLLGLVSTYEGKHATFVLNLEYLI